MLPLNLQMNETHILIRLLRMYIPWNWEFGSALAKLQNFGGGGVEPQNPLRYATDYTGRVAQPSAGRVLLFCTDVSTVM
jgi:hypothetical protein